MNEELVGYADVNAGEEVRPRTVKELDIDDQPRERALKYGVNSLSTPDLWALILRTGLRGKPITELCRDFMRENDNSLFRLERRDFKEIIKTKGLGPTKALQITAVMELIRRYNREKVGERAVIKDASSIYNLMRMEIGNLPHEEIWVIYLDRKNRVIGKLKSTSGSAVCTVFDIKKILKDAVLMSADGLALCHNHPSGNTRPSGEDDNITRKLRDACKLMEIRMLDHVVITASDYYSYYENGQL